MSIQLNDRVKETSATSGIIPIVLTGAPVGYQTVASSITSSNTFPYVVELVGGAEWEIGIGLYSSGNNSIIRTQILNSSNNGSIVNFSSGAKNVFITIPAAYASLTVRGLSQFANTTSAELASIISDETGSGKLVFSNNAILVTPSFSVANGTAPFSVISNTVVANLNVDFLDGQHGAYYTGLSSSAWDTANTAYSQANTGTILANSAYNQANSALALANAAFTKANSISTLVSTAIQTANYTASVNDLVRCNTAAGAFSVTFPASPIDGGIIAVSDIAGTFNSYNLTLLPNGKTIESDATGLILDMNGTYVSFVYSSSTSNWKLLETPLGGLAPTAIITSSYNASVNDIVRCNTAAGAFAITFPTSPSDGSLINVVDVAGTFYTNNLTINRGGTNTIEGDTSVILDINNAYTSFMYNTATANWRLLETPIGSLGNVTANTTVSGIVKISGTVLANAVAGVDYLTPNNAVLINSTITNPTITNPTITNPTITNYIESFVTVGTVISTNTISLTNGTVQSITLTASTACTFTMPTAVAGKSFVLLLKQAAVTGAGTATFTNVKWGTAGAPTITATAGKMDILTFISDGVNWYGSIAQGYTP